MVKTDKERITWIDMAKGFGIIAVFIGHMVQNSPLGSFVYSFHMPLFFFLSGYLFTSGQGFLKFLKKKSAAILLPYFTYGLIVVICEAIYPFILSGQKISRTVLNSLLSELSMFLLQRRYMVLWFLAVLFWVNILAFFITKIRSMLLQTIVSIGIFSLGMLYYHNGGEWLYWDLDAAAPAFLFFWAGYFCKYLDLIDGCLYKYAGKSVIAIFIFLVANILSTIINIRIAGFGLEMYFNSYGVPPLTIFAALSGIVFIILISGKRVLRPVRYIGKNSMLFFMWHQSVIYPLIDLLYRSIGIEGYGTSLFSFMTILLSRLVIAFLMMYLLNEFVMHIPFIEAAGK